MKLWILTFILGCPTLLLAQGTVKVAAPFSQYDSTRAVYIRSYPDHFALWPVFKQRSLDFVLQDLPNRDRRLRFNSNKTYGFGVGAYIFEVVIELTVAVPIAEKDKTIYGDSKARDLQLNLFGKKWGLDFFRQKYEGFYLTDPKMNVPANTPYPQRDDITTHNWRATGSYIFNNKKFSFRSAYNFTESQLKSAGSFVVFGSVSGFKTEGDSAILGHNYDVDFGRDSKVEKFKSTAISFAPGYTYSLIHRGFFINGTVALGPSHNWLYYRTETGETGKDLNFTAFFLARVSLGYNGERFFGGVSYVSQGVNAKFETVQLNTSTGQLKVLFGYRFREFGFLKKRLLDLPKYLGITS